MYQFDDKVRNLKQVLYNRGFAERDIITVPSEEKVYLSDALLEKITEGEDLNGVKLRKDSGDTLFRSLRLINTGKSMTAYYVW